MNTPTRDNRTGFARLTRHGAVGAVTVTLAVLSCYGVLALTALLPLLGIRLALDATLWAGAIALFTVLTAVAVLPGIATHGAWIPALAAIVGAGMILHALLVDYDARVELAGFLLLAAAVIRDVHLHRRARRVPGRSTPG